MWLNNPELMNPGLKANGLSGYVILSLCPGAWWLNDLVPVLMSLVAKD